MKLHRPFFYFLLATFALAFVSCSRTGENNDRNSKEFDEAEEGTITDELEGLTDNIPPPTEIPYMLQATGADFNQSLVNSREKVDQYTTQNDKAAMNLGVYAADIGYLTSYDKTQEALDYLTACKTLSEDLGLIGTFDAALLEEFENNISNKDSLARMVNRTMKESEQFLREGNRKQLSALVVAGGFIEGLYIATGLIKTYPKDILPEDALNVVLTPLIKLVLDQKNSVSEMVQILDAAEDSEMVKAIREDFRKLEQTYQDLNIEEQIKDNRADLVLSDKNLEGIATIVEKIRTRVTG